MEVRPTLQRVLKVWWLIFWRGLTLGLLGGALTGFLIGILSVPLGISEENLQLPVALLGGAVGISAGIWAVSTAFKKRFSDFRIALVEIETKPSSGV